MHAGRDSANEVKAPLSPADPSWPEQVRAEWEAYRQARTTANRLIAASRRLQAAAADEAAADAAWDQAYFADRDAEAAYEQFGAAWDQWQTGAQVSAEPDEPEAGS